VMHNAGLHRHAAILGVTRAEQELFY